ncbi:hypothetical protein OKW34_000229 [Paraburkholderia youngii]|uniref:hypothetical protein n=1 Tax=Paraburkholderia youngii TaxID=2782701 RepID=UPI003D1944BF
MMSDDAKALLHYASNWRVGFADDSDRAYCFICARNSQVGGAHHFGLTRKKRLQYPHAPASTLSGANRKRADPKR